MSSTEAVRVVVRCRPFNNKEAEAGYTKVVEIDPHRGSLSLKNPKNDVDLKTFTFDAVFDEDSLQAEVYNTTARQIVDAVLSGFNGTVFVYGQTGTGKTFSMQGVPEVPHLRGIIPNTFNHIFDHISTTKQKQFLVRISFLEIYNEEIRDLLKKEKRALDLKENVETGVYVKDLSSFVVKSVEEMHQLMNRGNKNRAVGATNMNEQSSRSHSIFTITIESSQTGVDGKDHIVAGKLHLVDLAGSERQNKTGATGDRLKEAAKINLSLSALGNCISALVDGKSSHIPYRDSKLTRLLQDSLGGNAKTLMIATMSPASYNYEETLSTLRYANRAKNIKNKPKINEDPKDTMLREYQEEIKRLKEMLEMKKQNMDHSDLPSADRKKRSRSRAAKSVPVSETSNSDDTIADVVNSDESPLGSMDLDTIAKLQEEIEAEKRALLESKDMAMDQKEKLLAELENRLRELNTTKKESDDLEKTLESLEAKLLVGGVNIFDRVNQQERELTEKRKKLAEEEQKERFLRQHLEAKQEATLQLEENYASLQEEVDAKTRKLQKLWGKLEEAKLEIVGLTDEFRTEREDLLDTIRQLTNDLNLKLTIIENFIPPEEVSKVEKRAVWDENIQEWQITPKRLQRPIACPGFKRPISLYAKRLIASGNTNPRYRPENILQIPLYLPEAATIDYADDNYYSDASGTLRGGSGNLVKKSSRSSLKNNGNRENSPEKDKYPSARNLVSAQKRFA
ncbi:P-loop containing nucleoside triphosphate hydrolase protein [Paraphysoderma sedebokerense]|nr:P-loop containing nucleoside triphosphate hydrolase protein [Paraphysoderma sedebokerense]